MGARAIQRAQRSPFAFVFSSNKDELLATQNLLAQELLLLVFYLQIHSI